jgi:hypothetical protein
MSSLTGNARVLLMAASILLLAGGAGWRVVRKVPPAEPAAERSAKVGLRDASSPMMRRDAASLSLEEILALPEPSHRLEELTDRALAIPQDEIPQALRSLSSDLVESPYAEILVRRWAERAPESAIAWLKGLASEPAERRLRVVAIAAWAGEEMAAAHRWVMMSAEPDERATLLLEVARAGVAASPLAALGIARELPSSSARDGLMAACLREWAATAPEEAAAWALALPDGVGRQSAVAEVATTVALHDSATATDLALDHIADDEVFAGAILGIVSQASGGEPERIREWIDRFPEGRLKHAARAEFTRIERGLLPSMKGLPGEDTEDRAPYAPPDGKLPPKKNKPENPQP